MFPVTSLEEMAIAETLELAESVARDFGITCSALLVNCASPMCTAGEERIAGLIASPSASPILKIAVQRGLMERERCAELPPRLYGHRRCSSPGSHIHRMTSISSRESVRGWSFPTFHEDRRLRGNRRRWKDVRGGFRCSNTGEGRGQMSRSDNGSVPSAPYGTRAQAWTPRAACTHAGRQRGTMGSHAGREGHFGRGRSTLCKAGQPGSHP